MKKKFSFSIRDAIPKAWDLIWADNLVRQKEDHYNPAQFYYVTASDV